MSSKPEFFGKYILLDKLATGGMAEVYLAKSLGAENVSKLLAVKRILPQFSQNTEFVDMFKEEAKIAINISHANVVSIFEFGEEAGQFFLVMEYVEGRNLRQILNRLNKTDVYFGIEDIIYIIKETANGLDHAHRHVDNSTGKPLNITHRDISPQNVMVSCDGEVKIVDFGIAKAESKLETTRAGTLKGKFGYMSPEQAEGMEVDYRTDIFSLGIVLWELLAKERLFLANNEVNTLKKIREARVPGLRKIDPTIPEELERIANKALARDRNLRYQSAGDLFRDLSRFINRHYPDYNTQDFANKIKSVYQKEREELRKKIVEFSKIRLPAMNEATQVVGEHTKTVTDTGKHVNETGITAPQNFISDAEMKEKSEINVKFDTNQKDLYNKTAALGDSRKRSTSPGFPRGSQTNYPYNTNTSVSYRATSSSSSSNFILGLVFAIGLSLVSFFFLQRKYPEITSHYYETTKMKVYAFLGKEYEGKVDQVSKSEPRQNAILVTSQPAGSEIYINNQFTGLSTPAQVRVPANQSFQVALKKEGYHLYRSKKMTAKDGEELSVKLVKANVGYVNINVRPGNATVYIDGKRLNKSPPIYNYPIPADKNVKITAFDPISQGRAETLVRVKRETRRDITLFLKKRMPSGAKRR